MLFIGLEEEKKGIIEEERKEVFGVVGEGLGSVLLKGDIRVRRRFI